MRLFLAAFPPPSACAQLESALRDLHRACPARVRWIRAEEVHLTLVFLGEIAPERLAALAEAVSAVAPRHPVLQMSFGERGAFPTLDRPRVLWLGLHGDKRLPGLQHGLAEATRPFVAAPEPPGRFHPHLTLGRVKPAAPPDLRALAAWWRGQTVTLAGQWRVERILLMRSEPGSAGARYAELASMPLAKTSG
jgi:2'-5' RNA ligase